MRANRRSRWQAATLSVATLASTCVVVAGSAGPAQADPGCVNGGVYMLFARGSGAVISPSNPPGPATEANTFRNSVASALGGVPSVWSELGNLDGSVGGGQQVDTPLFEYPAAGGPNVAAALYAWLVQPTYNNSVRIGTDELVNHLNQRYGNGPGDRNCWNETVVLGGYSQGADVVGWALERNGGGGYVALSAAARNHIGAVALYGDPKYIGNFGQYTGCYQPPWAILSETCPPFPNVGILGARNPYVPNDIWSRVSSYCDQSDGVCHGSIVLALAGSHTYAYKNTWIAASANRVAAIAISKRNQLNPSLPPAPGGQTPSSGPPPQAAPSSSSPSRQMFLRGDSTVFAKDSLGDGGWVQESDAGSINKIAVGGTTQMVLNACNAVYAKDTLGNGGWVQEAPCGGANQIAVSSTGVQMLIDACSAVWAKVGIGYGGWTQEVGCGNATAIAVGGNTQMFIRGDAAIFAKDSIGANGWTQEVGPGNAGAIAIDNTGLQAFIRGDAAVFAKRGIGDGGWVQQVGPGNAGAIAAGGGVLMFLRGDSAVFAKTNISIDGGWTQESDPGTANLIDVGDNGRQMIRTGDNAVWAKDGIGYGGWLPQVGAGNANAIAIG